jgi:hypothetical protein
MNERFSFFWIGLIALLFSSHVHAQIHSTSSGGPWDSTWTWVGGFVPNAAHDVVINGPVGVSANSCKNLTINPTGTIMNNFYTYVLNIHGDVENHGSIKNHASGYLLTTRVHGDISNNGVWSNYKLELHGTADQAISQQTGSVFTVPNIQSYKSGGHLHAITDLNFENVILNLDFDTLYVAPNKAIAKSGGYIYRGKLLNSGNPGDTFFIDFSDAAFLYDCDITNATLVGTTDCRANNFYGHTINNGTLQNAFYTYHINFHGLFTNNGIIRNHESGYQLHMFLYGDIINNGSWMNHKIAMKGDLHQTYTQMNNSVIETFQFVMEKTANHLEALTDIYFRNCMVDFVNDTLRLQDNGLLGLDGGYLYRAVVLANDAKNGSIDLLFHNNAILYAGCHIHNPNIRGCVNVRSVNFYGDVLVTDTLQNSFNTYNIYVDGNIVNNGTIRNYPGAGFYLHLYVSQNIINNGVWSNTFTYLNGVTEQQVTCQNGSAFTSFQFTCTNNTEPVVFYDDVRFSGTQIRFNNNSLTIESNSTLSIHNGFLYQASVKGTGAHSKIMGIGQHNVDAPYLQIVSLENLTLGGVIKIHSGCSFSGSIINNGFLCNSFNTYYLDIYDHFVNNGTIANYPGSGFHFHARVYGNFENHNIWSAQSIDLKGTDDQQVSLAGGKTFEVASVVSNKPSGKINALTNLTFVNSIMNLNYDTLIMPNGTTLSMSGGYMYRAVVVNDNSGSGHYDFHLSNGTYIENSTLINPRLTGTTSCKTTTMSGDVVNDGILENMFNTYSVTINGNIWNNGIIRNFVGSGYHLYLFVKGNFTNNGLCINSSTRMTGTTDQYIYLQNGNEIAGQLQFISDVSVSPYQWHWNGTPITNPTPPNPDPFNGENTATLTFNWPVEDFYFGSYYCVTGGGNSRALYVAESTGGIRLNVKALLEGPFNGTEMNTDLNPILPLQQSLAVIGYSGTETVASIPNADIVDWIGVELRDAPDINSADWTTTIAGGAFFLLKDGTVVSLNGTTLPFFDPTVTNQLFVALWPRNHLPVISNVPLTESGGVYSYDFSTAISQAYGNNQSDLGGGLFGLIGGNVNGDGEINMDDLTNVWNLEAGTKGYLQGDANMDGQVNNKDKNDLILKNFGKMEVLP